jgi:hypothetical protein
MKLAQMLPSWTDILYKAAETERAPTLLEFLDVHYEKEMLVKCGLVEGWRRRRSYGNENSMAVRV